MKILDIPQSGKRGLNVSQNGRYGQISRALVIPTNPQTTSQLNVRTILAEFAAKWRTLTQETRLSWIAEAALHQTKARLGQSGPMTGLQLYTKLNAAAALLGGEELVLPTAPAYADLKVTGLQITNTAGVIALKLATSGALPEFSILRASKPVSAGREVCNDDRVLGLVPEPAAGYSTFTALYTAKYGIPAVGAKIFVRVNQCSNGWEDIPVQFSAVVPAAA